MRDVPPQAEGLAWAGTAILIWAGWFVVTRVSVTHVLGPEDIVALRFGVGALVLLPVLLRAAARLGARAWREGVLLAIGWGAPFVLLLGHGLTLAPAGLASALTPGAMPLFAGGLAWLVLGERPGWQRGAGFVLIAAGVAALSSGTVLTGGLRGLAADGLLLAASTLWAGYTLRIRRSGLTGVQAAGIVCVVSSLGFLPFYLLLGWSRLHLASGTEIAAQALYQGVVVSGLSVVAWNRAVLLLGAGPAAAMASLVPVVTAVLAIPVLGEVPGILSILATGSIVLGVCLAGTARREPPAGRGVPLRDTRAGE